MAQAGLAELRDLKEGSDVEVVVEPARPDAVVLEDEVVLNDTQDSIVLWEHVT